MGPKGLPSSAGAATLCEASAAVILGGVGWAVPGAVAAPRPCSGILADGNDGFHLHTLDSAITREGDLMRVLDVLAQDVGVIGVFSDWPATVRFCASFKGLN